MNTPALPRESPFALLDELLEAGVISAKEHQQQCQRLAYDLARQHRRELRREDATAHLRRYAPPNNPLTTQQEPHMNPQDLLKTMELNQKIMSEQLKALNGHGTSGRTPHLARPDSTDNAAELINHLANGHLNSAAQSLQALAGVAARVRSEWYAENRSPVTSAVPAVDEVIDVETVEARPTAGEHELPSRLV